MRIILPIEVRVRGNEARMEIVAVDDVGMQIEGPDGRKNRAVEEYRPFVLVGKRLAGFGDRVNSLPRVETVVVDEKYADARAGLETGIDAKPFETSGDAHFEHGKAGLGPYAECGTVDRRIERRKNARGHPELLELVRQRPHHVGEPADFREGNDLRRYEDQIKISLRHVVIPFS